MVKQLAETDTNSGFYTNLNCAPFFGPPSILFLRHRFASMEVLLPPRFGFAAHLIHLLCLLNLVSHKLGVFGGIKMPVKKMYQLGAWQPPSTPRLIIKKYDTA